MRPSKPTFSANKKVARYISLTQRDRDTSRRRAQSSAFYDAKGGNGLSLNSLEIHTQKQVAAIYSLRFDENRPIAMAVHTTQQYVNALNNCGVGIAWNKSKKHWEHKTGGGMALSLKHDPRLGDKNRKQAPKDDSHSLLTGYCELDQDDMKRTQFANIMIRTPPYKVV